jgi:hypothetical protein
MPGQDTPMPTEISIETVARIRARHGQVYKRIAPVHQTAMLNDLLAV